MKWSEIINKNMTYFFVKFTPKEYIERFRAGNIHMKNLKTYIDMEKESGVTGIGDKLEASLFLNKPKLQMADPDSGEVLIDMELKNTTIWSEEDLYHPVFCVYVIDSDSLKVIKDDYDGVTTKMDISEEDLDDLIRTFGETAILIKASEFIERFKESCKKKGFTYQSSKAKYYNFSVNEKERVDAFFADNPYEKAFIKRSIFEMQNEFRFILTNHTTIDFYDFNIGDISDITFEMDIRDIFVKNQIKFKKHSI